MTILRDSSMKDVLSLPEFRSMKGQFVYAADKWFSGSRSFSTITELASKRPGIAAEDTVLGLNRLRDVARQHEKYVFSIHKGRRASLVWMPAKERKHDTVCLLLSGGAYSEVNSMFEAIPAAAKLNEEGYDCFFLNYRTIDSDALVNGLMPTPMEDLREAIQKIHQIYPDASYHLLGFSTGGNVCALWCTKQYGARKYDLPNPCGVLLAYPLISLLSLPHGPSRDYLMQGVFGTGYSREIALRYDVRLLVDSAFPPVYLVRADDDYTIPHNDATSFDTVLSANRIEHQFEILHGCGHGFGTGSGTAAENWLYHGIAWMDAHTANGRHNGKEQTVWTLQKT